MTKLALQILLRYIAALLVACVTSFAAFAVGLQMLQFFSPEVDFPTHVLMLIIGFLGVFSGTYCLERTTRCYGSIVLLGAGLGFTTWLWTVMRFSINPPPPFVLPPFFWDLMVGGSMAVLFFWIKSFNRRKSQIDVKANKK